MARFVQVGERLNNYTIGLLESLRASRFLLGGSRSPRQTISPLSSILTSSQVCPEPIVPQRPTRALRPNK